MLFGLCHVVGHHFDVHFLGGYLGHPVQLSLGFGRITQQGLDLDRSEARVILRVTKVSPRRGLSWLNLDV